MPAQTEIDQYHLRLRRELHLIDLVMMALGSIIGAGWLFAAAEAAQMAGPASIVSWLIGGLAMLCISLVYAELGSMIPEAGATIRYPHYSHGVLVGFTVGWAQWIAYAAVPVAESTAVVDFTAPHFPVLAASSALQVVVKLALVGLFIIINLFAVKVFSRVNVGFTFLKLLLPPITIVAVFEAAHHFGNFTSHGFAPAGVAGILHATAAAGVVFAYAGFRAPVEMAGEAKNPRRDIPIALFVAIGFSIVVYELLQGVFVAALPSHVLAHGWASLNLVAASPFVGLATLIGVMWLGKLLTVGSAFSPAVTGNIYTGTSSRLLYAMSRNRYLPPVLGKLHHRTRAPFVAVFVSSVIGMLFLPFQALIGVITAASVLTYVTGPTASAVIRRRSDRGANSFHLPGFHVIGPVAFVVGSLLIYWTGWNTDWKVLVLVLVGVVLFVILSRYVWAGRTHTLTKADFRSGWWFIAYLVALLGLSLIGSGQFGSPLDHHRGILHFPSDIVVVSVVSLCFYYLGVRSGLHPDEIPFEDLDLAEGPETDTARVEESSGEVPGVPGVPGAPVTA